VQGEQCCRNQILCNDVMLLKPSWSRTMTGQEISIIISFLTNFKAAIAAFDRLVSAGHILFVLGYSIQSILVSV
jgi:hypothetical protein